jgi:DNA-binding transcriptional LysR family regulator
VGSTHRRKIERHGGALREVGDDRQIALEVRRRDVRRGRVVVDIEFIERKARRIGLVLPQVIAQVAGLERLKHVNVVPPGHMRAGLHQALAQQQLRRDVAISVTNFFAVAEMVAVTDYCATLPNLICRRLAHDQRLKVLSAPGDLGTFPVEMAWHVRYRHDPAHRWLRTLIGQVAEKLSATGATG